MEREQRVGRKKTQHNNGAKYFVITILRRLESFLEKKNRLNSWFICSKITSEYFIERSTHRAISNQHALLKAKKHWKYRFLTIKVKLALKTQIAISKILLGTEKLICFFMSYE